jgi:hypothetical protein
VSARRRGLIVALAQVLLVSSLGAKFLYDRATRPRVWAKAAPVDPYALFRGRYLRLALEVECEAPCGDAAKLQPVELRARGDRLSGVPTQSEDATHLRSPPVGGGAAVLAEPLALFIPDSAKDPTESGRRRDLWVEVTLPKRGLPRPIRLGVERDGSIVPLDEAR